LPITAQSGRWNFPSGHHVVGDEFSQTADPGVAQVFELHSHPQHRLVLRASEPFLLAAVLVPIFSSPLRLTENLWFPDPGAVVADPAFADPFFLDRLHLPKQKPSSL
jgi:hypothetical protein